MLATMLTTSLANNLSIIGSFVCQNQLKANLSEEKLTTVLLDDSLKVDVDEFYSVVDVEPSFPGGPEAMTSWLQSQIIYPESAIENKEQGTVYIKFIIRKDGTISHIDLIKGVSVALDQEAIRVISLMPKWIPGKLNGEFVNSYFTLPIAFRLSGPPQKKSRR
jgi:TonB family protein